MNHRRSHSTSLAARSAPWRAALLVGALGAGAALGLAQEGEVAELPTSRAETPQLRDKDHEELAKRIEDYFEARTASKGVLEAREELEERVASLEKRNDVDDLLALSADWEAALLLAKKYTGSPQGKGRLKDFTFEGVFGDEIEYWLHGPKSYRSSSPTPLVIVIPDAQQKIDEMLRDDWIEEGTGIEDEFVIVSPRMPGEVENWIAMGSKGRPGGVDRVLQVYKRVTTEWNVDPERVFLCGMEDGVAAAVRIAGLYPDRFAGVIGRSGDPMDMPIENFSNLPLMLASGANNATAMGRRAEELGWSHVATPASATTQEVLDWMRAQERRRHPREVHLRPLELFGRDAYWVRAEGFEIEKSPWLHAVADRETNTVTVQGEGVSRVILFFTDRLLDLDRPVTVVVGGVKHEHTVDRNLEFMLERARSTGDPGRAYVGQRFYDFPEPVAEGEGDASGSK